MFDGCVLMAKEKKYGLSTVAQSNKLVEAIHGMTLTEKRLFIHASGLARQQDLKEGEVLTIRADEFAKECGIESHTAYEGLQDAVERLFGRYFSYVSGDGHPVKCRWVYRLEYKKGMGEIDVSFPAEVIFMFTVFNKENPFTIYDRKYIQQMTSVYAIRFYELFMQYRSIGNRTLELDKIKTMFQLDQKYDRIFDLKKRVVDVALDQINQHTDYTVTYEQVKRGRTVHALKFYFVPKKTVMATTLEVPKNNGGRDEDTPDLFTGLTDKQAKFFASKLAQEHEISGLASEPTYQEVEARLARELLDPEGVKKYMPYLKKNGFKQIKKG
jgi:plasmid replication initiation protein